MCKNSLWRDGYQVLGGCLVMQCGDRLWDEWWNRSSGEGLRHSNGWLSSVVVPTYVHAARPLAGRLLDLMARTKKKKKWGESSGGQAPQPPRVLASLFPPTFAGPPSPRFGPAWSHLGKQRQRAPPTPPHR